MRSGTPTRDEMVAELGEDHVETLEGDDCPEGFDLLDRLFVHAHLAANGGPLGPDEVGSAYLRARAAGACPCHGLPDLYWNHWTIDDMCDMFPCQSCVDDNVFTAEAIAGAEARVRDRDRDTGDDAIPDDTIPF